MKSTIEFLVKRRAKMDITVLMITAALEVTVLLIGMFNRAF